MKVLPDMTDLQPCLLGCDLALAEAERLVTIIAACPDGLEAELAAVQKRIARLRTEVERLRGLPTLRVRRKNHPDWRHLSAAPWPEPPPAAGIDA